MEINNIQTNKGDLSRCNLTKDETINSTSDFLSILMSCPTNTVVLDKEHITTDFYNLRTGLAGDFLQKVSNYRKRLIILGDFKNISSKSLNDFIYESNKNGTVIFIDKIEDAIKLLQ